MLRLSSLVLALAVTALAGCSSDRYDDGYYGGPIYGVGYGYSYFDDYDHHHGRHDHHDKRYKYLPHRGVVCDRQTARCYDADDFDRDWPDDMFGDTTRHQKRSGGVRSDIQARPEASEDAPHANLGDQVRRMPQRSRSASDAIVPQFQQEQPRLRPSRPNFERSSGPMIRVPRGCSGAGCR